MPPISSPIRTAGSDSENVRSIVWWSLTASSDSSTTNAANSTSAASTAEPIA